VKSYSGQRIQCIDYFLDRVEGYPNTSHTIPKRNNLDILESRILCIPNLVRTRSIPFHSRHKSICYHQMKDVLVDVQVLLQHSYLVSKCKSFHPSMASYLHHNVHTSYRYYTSNNVNRYRYHTSSIASCQSSSTNHRYMKHNSIGRNLRHGRMIQVQSDQHNL